MLAATVIACGGGEAPEGDDGLGAWGEVRLIEDLRIGLSEGDESYLFGDIGGIVQDTDGSVIILDSQVPIIRRYDAEGAYLHDFGRAGEGPGEYQRVQGMVLLPDGNLAIWDTGACRISVFAPGGAYVRGFPAGASGYFYSGSGLRIDGTIWVRRYAEAYDRNRPPRAPGDRRPTFDWWQLPTFDAFDDEGTFLGSIELPNETRPETLHSDWVWTSQPNEDEEIVAIRYRIEKSGR